MICGKVWIIGQDLWQKLNCRDVSKYCEARIQANRWTGYPSQYWSKSLANHSPPAITDSSPAISSRTGEPRRSSSTNPKGSQPLKEQFTAPTSRSPSRIFPQCLPTISPMRGHRGIGLRSGARKALSSGVCFLLSNATGSTSSQPRGS